ncbi:unnamed protein product [Lactuca saligna]|uniref:Phospholipase A1 n=1 Tax=Lactuca saligna TaxID=75948 RepID=A0AA35VPX0_LACSI|nr:unnamed protein product [Lactuca saligna]
MSFSHTKKKQGKNTHIHEDMDNISKNWKTLSGETNWKGLLDPPKQDLRNYIIHYGEMAQATYDAFNSVKLSKYAGSCRYARTNLLSKSLSREAWCKESNWMGFVAVATDEGKVVLGRRDILIAWRGTIQTMEWVNDLDFTLVSAPIIFGENNDDDNPKIHQGWYSVYTTDDPRSPYNKTNARDQLLHCPMIDRPTFCHPHRSHRCRNDDFYRQHNNHNLNQYQPRSTPPVSTPPARITLFLF